MQAKDEYNATIEEDLSAVLLDVFRQPSPSHFVELNSTVNLEMIWVEPVHLRWVVLLRWVEERMKRAQCYSDWQRSFTGKYEVTQAQYEAVMTGNTLWPECTEYWPDNPNRPVSKLGKMWFLFSV